jgi:hypothetical protein
MKKTVTVRCTDTADRLGSTITMHEHLIRDDDQRVTAQRKADARLRPRAPQAPCDVGLFGDEPKQTDLVDPVRRTLTPRE